MPGDSHYIKIDNVSLEFIKYSNLNNNLKENVIKFFLNFGQKSFRQEVFRVLNDITFELRDGDRLAIIGRNGAGKTTLLKVMCGIYRPNRGTVDVRGRISSLIEIGAGFNPELTGRENIYLSGLISGFSRREIAAKEDEVIAFADIGDFIDTPVKYYSTGMGARLAFSIATSIDPEIVIVDELFAGGDINFVAKAQARIDQIITNARIFVAAPHNMEYVRKLCNKVLYLSGYTTAYFGEDVEYAIDRYVKDNTQ